MFRNKSKGRVEPPATPQPATPPPTAAVPDFMLDPHAVLKDDAKWRHGKVPDYSAARAKYARVRL